MFAFRNTVRKRFFNCCVVNWSLSKMFSTKLLPSNVGFDAFNAAANSPEIKYLHSLFKSANYELRIAGGAVRDILRGEVPQDIDFATDATPSQMIELLSKYEKRIRLILTRSGEKHGTVIARIDDKVQFEVTTLRIDKKTDGRHAEVEFIKDWQLDALRRDLTINSMFLDLDGNLYDFFNGHEHLKNNVIKFVGSTIDRITEDYLRILRYFRFFARYGGEKHDPEVIEAMQKLKDGLSAISGERLWSEMKKIITLKRCCEVIPVMIDIGILEHFGLNSVSESDLEEFKRVYSNLTSNEFTFEPMTLFSALFRDEDGVLRSTKRLRFSNLEKNIALYIVLNRGGRSDLRTVKTHLAINNKNDFNSSKKCALEFFKYSGDRVSHDELSGWDLPHFPIRGNVVLERLEKKRMISNVLLELKKSWAKSDFELTEQDLLSQLDTIVESLSK